MKCIACNNDFGTDLPDNICKECFIGKLSTPYIPVRLDTRKKTILLLSFASVLSICIFSSFFILKLGTPLPEDKVRNLAGSFAIGSSHLWYPDDDKTECDPNDDTCKIESLAAKLRSANDQQHNK